MKAGGPVLILFLLVIGGIYLGVFTPTEGGAIGSVVALILGLIYKRFNFRIFAGTLLESGQVMSMVFLTLIGAVMFNVFIGWCNVIPTLTNLIVNANLSPLLFMVIIIVIIGVAGMFLNGLSLILIGIPVIFPISKTLGLDPIWFLMLVAIAMNLGNLTPPVGINLFVLKGMRPETPMSAIYKGAMPFALATLVAIVILYIIPSLTTWLPEVLR
jgi:tripartite ATP-independent transporter DctM subunit